MSNVVLIKPPPKSIFRSGMARCLACKHEWVQVLEGSELFFPCPSCSLEHGHFMYTMVRKEPHWQCNCGNTLFSMVSGGIYCPECGDWQKGF